MHDTKSIVYLVLYYILSGIVFVFNGCSSATGYVFYYTYLSFVTLLSVALALFCVFKIKTGHKVLAFSFGTSLLVGGFNLLSSSSLMFGSIKSKLLWIALTYPSMSFSNGIGNLLNYSDKPAYLWESSQWALSSNIAQIVFSLVMLAICFKKIETNN